MKKKIFIGSVLVLVMFLIMPSIPAIQQKTIEDRASNDFVDQLDFKDVKELVDSGKLDRVKHPLLYFFVILVAGFRWWRCIILFEIAIEQGWLWTFEVKYPILFLRFMWLGGRLEFWDLFWNNLSDTFGWNWEDIHDIIWAK